ncbi:MAG: hypothetical protein ACYDHO_01760 [Gaiellaceae bacterium]
MHDFDTWSRPVMSLAMTAWAVVVGAVAYIAVRLAQGSRRWRSHP